MHSNTRYILCRVAIGINVVLIGFICVIDLVRHVSQSPVGLACFQVAIFEGKVGNCSLWVSFLQVINDITC
jgi:hypothetical protein